ncbi:MAG: DUF664 domain-containing protein [Nocardioides sp.]
MTDAIPSARLAADVQHYLAQARASLVRALDGLGEYDVRRPLTPSGTNLLGLVEHLTGIELGYLGECVGLGDAAWWSEYVARIQAAADAHRADPAGS